MSQRAFNGINLSPNTPAMPLTPGLFVMSDCAWSSGICDKSGRFLWYSFWRELFPETINTRSCRFPFVIRGWSFLFEPCYKSGTLGKTKGFRIESFSNWGYQNWVCHAGVIKINFAWSIKALCKTLPIRENGGNSYSFVWVQHIWKASLPLLYGSSFQET